MSHINKRFYNEYILALRERHQYDRQSHPHFPNVFIGDIVLVKDVYLPRLCWKKGILQNYLNETYQGSMFKHCCINYKQNAVY